MSPQPQPTTESLIALRSQAMQQLRDSLRPGQQQMADWQGGPLAVSAVPGAGKSTGMARAAAIAIARHQLHLRRQLVVVTFTRSAAANIKAKIRQCLRDLSLPQGGFMVYTLHGLALNIATRYPDLSGLNLEESVVLTSNQRNRLLRACVERWIVDHPRPYQRLLEGVQFDGEETERLRRLSVLRTEVLPALTSTAIHEAKSSGLLPEDLRQAAAMLQQAVDDPYGILTIAAGLYDNYQALLRSRNLIDYDEMILAALRVLKDDSARQRWQQQVFAVFEDEAQDSAPLQTRLLELLATNNENPDAPLNLIRVGDPNQAINSTFTPADPIFFRDFCQHCDRAQRLATMDRAGRSSGIIIQSANFLLDWANDHTVGQPFRRQHIHPVSADDPQPNANPKPIGRGLELQEPEDIQQTLERIGRRLIQIYAQDAQVATAILVRENRQGRFMAEALEDRLRDRDIELYEVGQQDRHSHVPAEILALMQFLDRPHSPDYLKAALTVLVKRQIVPTQDLNALASLPEQFLYPGPLDPPQPDTVQRARRFCTSLLRARLELPLYRLITFLALALRYDPTELATADKLADRIARQSTDQLSMSQTLLLLRDIVSSKRFEPVETENAEARFNRPGQVTIITMHKAKGLDWDCVFLPFLQENVIPGSAWVPPQRQFLGEFVLEEVARAQIRAIVHGQTPLPDVAEAWQQAGHLKTAEEYRLLYVAMTRAKRLLWLSAARQAPFTWSKPENRSKANPSPAFVALKHRFPGCLVR